jgi:hypothetical protein
MYRALIFSSPAAGIISVTVIPTLSGRFTPQAVSNFLLAATKLFDTWENVG